MAQDLNSIIELDNSPELYKTFPVKFFQDKNLSDSSRALGGYLHSLPPNWTPRPSQIKEHFGWGKRKWDKVCGELRKEGYMELLRGGSLYGSRLKFSIHKNFAVKVCVDNIDSRKLQKATVAFCDSRIMRPYRNNKNNNNTNKTDLKKQTTGDIEMERDDKVVVEFDFLMKKGFNRQDARALFEQYGSDKCREAIKISTEKPERPGNLPAYIRGVLKRMIALPTKKGPSVAYCMPYNTVEETTKRMEADKLIPKSQNRPQEWKDLVRNTRSETA